MRGRGLKHVEPFAGSQINSVALHAGAWIETVNSLALSFAFLVALHAGAWIETPSTASSIGCNKSPSMRGRGLKLASVEGEDNVTCRPPCGGVD